MKRSYYFFFSLVTLFCTPLSLASFSPIKTSGPLWTQYHNMYRATVNPPASPPLPDMVYNSSLANQALQYAERCDFTHSGLPNVGENLAVSNGYNLTENYTVFLWAEERFNYDFNTNTCAVNKTCGHIGERKIKKKESKTKTPLRHLQCRLCGTHQQSSDVAYLIAAVLPAFSTSPGHLLSVDTSWREISMEGAPTMLVLLHLVLHQRGARVVPLLLE